MRSPLRFLMPLVVLGCGVLIALANVPIGPDGAEKNRFVGGASLSSIQQLDGRQRGASDGSTLQTIDRSQRGSFAPASTPAPVASNDPNTNNFAWWGMTSNSGFQASFTNAAMTLSLTANNAPTSQVGKVSRAIYLQRTSVQTLSFTNSTTAPWGTNGNWMMTLWVNNGTNLDNITMVPISKWNGGSGLRTFYIEMDGRTNSVTGQNFAHYDMQFSTNNSDSSAVMYYTNFPVASNIVASVTGGIMQTNQWHMLAMGNDGISNYFTIDNGTPVTTSYPGKFSTNSANLIIGSLNGSELWQGLISEVAVYNCKYSQAIVASNYNAGAGRTFTSP